MTDVACPYRDCGAPTRTIRTIVQDGTGAKSTIRECTRRPDIHRVWVLENSGAVVKLARPRFGWMDKEVNDGE